MSAVAGQAGVNEVTNMTVTLLHSSAADDNEAEEHSITSSRLGGGVAALGALGASGGGDAAAEVALTATVWAGAVIVPERACVSSAERACNDAGSIQRGTCLSEQIVTPPWFFTSHTRGVRHDARVHIMVLAICFFSFTHARSHLSHFCGRLQCQKAAHASHHCSIAGCDRHTPLLPLQQRSERLVMTLAN
jgi:hypothetical protein